MSAPPAVSVIVTAYNIGRYVREAVESVLRWDPDGTCEIIVVDDGSGDDTRDALAPLAESGKIKYIYQENEGQASATNRGYAASRGNIVAFLDGDDYWAPGRLRRLLELFEKNGYDAIFANLEMRWENSRVPGPRLFRSTTDLGWARDLGNFVHELPRNLPCPLLTTTSGISLRRAVCEKIFPIPEDFVRHIDIYLFFMALMETPALYDLLPQAIYRQHPASHMHEVLRRRNPRSLRIEERANAALCREIQKRNRDGDAAAILEKRRERWRACRLSLLLAEKRYIPAAREFLRGRSESRQRP